MVDGPRPRLPRGVAAFTVAVSLAASAACADDEARRYTFSWPFTAGDAMRPRGGTTTGPAVELLETPSEAWEALRDPSLSPFERDRLAILAMTGGYRTTFDFIETAGFVAGYAPSRPYQSWATEYVFVAEEQEDFLSLQHVIVMLFVDGSGNVQGPFVQKHWRQDWRYEDPSLHVYAGHERWQRVEHSGDSVRGRWSQAVFQVDDSPRYEALGEWIHTQNYSAWTSDETWRPLPRRESSVRADYHVLIGSNRHAITPTGWVHEEDNLKVALDAEGKPKEIFAREVGLNRYERVVGFDFSSAEAYWSNTRAFWADVREAWREIKRDREAFALAEEIDGRALFVPMFEYAEALDSGEPYDADASRQFVRETLARYLDSQ
jgi:hypothetical protein